MLLKEEVGVPFLGILFLYYLGAVLQVQVEVEVEEVLVEVLVEDMVVEVLVEDMVVDYLY
jgi:hypothetical protein